MGSNATSKANAVPAYVVLNNAALEELARHRPQTAEALLGVKGIGPGKVKQYGRLLLEMLALRDSPATDSPTAESPSATSPKPGPAAPAPPQETCRAGESRNQSSGRRLTPQTNTSDTAAFDDEAMDRGPTTVDAAPTASVQHEPTSVAISEAHTNAAESSDVSLPSHYWTWRLLDRGFTPDEFCGDSRRARPKWCWTMRCSARLTPGHAIDALVGFSMPRSLPKSNASWGRACRRASDSFCSGCRAEPAMKKCNWC